MEKDWILEAPNESDVAYRLYMDSTKKTENIADIYRTSEEKETDKRATILFEAGNVYGETGLTPKQLLEQRNELLEAAKDCKRTFEMHKNGGCNGEGRMHEEGSPYVKVLAAIKKASV